METTAGPNCGIFGQAGAIGYGLSETGSVCGEVGQCNGDQLPFVQFPGGSVIVLTATGAAKNGQARAVNSFGVVVGHVDTNALSFVWEAGNVTWLPPLPGDNVNDALAINDMGNVAGTSLSSSVLSACAWFDGKATNLNLPIGPGGTAHDINEANEVCGWMGNSPSPDFGASPFVWNGGMTTTLPLPQQAANNSGAATAINNHGDACGYYFIYDEKAQTYIRQGCAWIGGELIELGSLPNLPVVFPLDINDAREIIGYCIGFNMRPFVWRNGMMHDLNDLVPPGSPPLQNARAINNRGQIAGSGIGAGNSIAFLLTPALPAHPGDTDCDSQVNINDLLNVINRWNPQGPVGGEPADLNRDNKIDHADLLETILHWGL